MAERSTIRLPSPESALKIGSVIIGGANIAGATTALVLGQAGMRITCIDQHNLLKEQTPACNGCGGLIQERTVRLIEGLGISLEEATRRDLDGFIVHLPTGERVRVKAPMKAVYRGWGPARAGDKSPGLDALILKTALQNPNVKFVTGRITDVDLAGETAQVYLEGNQGNPPLLTADFFVGAFGHNLTLVKEHIKVPGGYQLDAPTVQKSSVNEIFIGEEELNRCFGNYVHVLIIPLAVAKGELNTWFAAFVPKNLGALTMVLMGVGDITPDDVENFMSSPYVKKLLPQTVLDKMRWSMPVDKGGCSLCACVKNTITVKPPPNYLIPRLGGGVLVGDAGRTRPYKDGLGAAVRTAVEVAYAIINGDFSKFQQLIDRNFPADDHIFAQKLMGMNDIFINQWFLRQGLLVGAHIPGVAHLIQAHMRHLLTGDVPYQDILPRQLAKILFRIFDG